MIFTNALLAILSAAVGKAQILMETDEPELPEVVVVKEVINGTLVYKGGDGEILDPIVDPDRWTPFPTLPPVVTGSPTTYPTPLSPAPTTNPYYLWHNGSHDQCIFDTALMKDDCLDAAMLVGKAFNFPYYLNIIESSEAPCGCFLWYNENGDPIVDYNTNTPAVGGCAANVNARLICTIPPPTMAPSPGENCYNLENTYYASEANYCYRVETGKGTNHFRQRPISQDCPTKFTDTSSPEWYVGSASLGQNEFYNGHDCNGFPREGILNIIEEDRADTVGSATSYMKGDVCFYEVTIRRPPCLGTYAPVDPTPEPTPEPTQFPTYPAGTCFNVSFKTGSPASHGKKGDGGRFYIDGYGVLPGGCHYGRWGRCNMQFCDLPNDELKITATKSKTWNFEITGDIGPLIDYETWDGTGTHFDPFPTWLGAGKDKSQTYKLQKAPTTAPTPNPTLAPTNPTVEFGQIYYIKHQGTGKYLDVFNGACSNSNRLHLWELNGSGAQKFYVKEDGAIMNLGCEKALQITNCNDEGFLQIFDYNGNVDQQFDGVSFITNRGCGVGKEIGISSSIISQTSYGSDYVNLWTTGGALLSNRPSNDWEWVPV